jgi:hypothetical protein
MNRKWFTTSFQYYHYLIRPTSTTISFKSKTIWEKKIIWENGGYSKKGKLFEKKIISKIGG